MAARSKASSYIDLRRPKKLHVDLHEHAYKSPTLHEPVTPESKDGASLRQCLEGAAPNAPFPDITRHKDKHSLGSLGKSTYKHPGKVEKGPRGRKLIHIHILTHHCSQTNKTLEFFKKPLSSNINIQSQCPTKPSSSSSQPSPHPS